MYHQQHQHSGGWGGPPMQQPPPFFNGPPGGAVAPMYNSDQYGPNSYRDQYPPQHFRGGGGYGHHGGAFSRGGGGHFHRGGGRGGGRGRGRGGRGGFRHGNDNQRHGGVGPYQRSHDRHGELDSQDSSQSGDGRNGSGNPYFKMSFLQDPWAHLLGPSAPEPTPPPQSMREAEEVPQMRMSELPDNFDDEAEEIDDEPQMGGLVDYSDIPEAPTAPLDPIGSKMARASLTSLLPPPKVENNQFNSIGIAQPSTEQSEAATPPKKLSSLLSMLPPPKST